ncbi:hypothetical protein DRO58_04205 [Candidatus Bathyarchaeota archaeon]|nr:MAG: hypothetical protein DRO58_04205 [Candidatus Bathyarchaeota archaeon]
MKVERGSIELKQILVNNVSVESWSADKLVASEGEEINCTLKYDWRMGEDYVFKVITVDNQSAEQVVKAPVIHPNISIDIKNVSIISNSKFLRVNVAYRAHGEGIDTLHTILFTYSSFNKFNHTLYIFYDPDFMADESLKRADAIVKYFHRYGIEIYKIDFNALEILSKAMLQRSILIVVNPLKDKYGRRLEDALPAPLIDPDRDGKIKDNSRYGKSFIYDWMRDKGLIFITVGSLQPHKRILYKDGIYNYARDSFETFDVHLFFTDATGKEGIIEGRFILGDYSPTRITGTLGLSYREESFGFDKNALERYGLRYYGYGDYKLFREGVNFNLTLPVFIRVGKGGWLVMSDEGYWLSDEQLAHDLFLIYMQSVWDSEWIPYGWYWDNGGTFHECAGVLKVNDRLETGSIPSDIIGRKLVIRILGIAYSSDLKEGIVVEKVLEYPIFQELH